MRIKVIALASLACIVTSAHAQSSVTLFGVLDEGFDYTSNVGGNRVYELTSGYASGSRWGLRGVEDLGGGTKAVFQLESGINLSNGAAGQGGRMFGRQAYVGVTDNRLGSVTLGRQYDSVVDYLAPTTANGNFAGYLFAHPFDNDNTDNSFRVNNTVKYASPSFGGFRFGGTYSFSNDTNFANNRQYSIGASYANSGLLIGAAYLRADGVGMNANGAIATNDASFIAQRMQIFGAGVNYTFGKATAGFAYTNSSYRDPVTNGYIGGSLASAGNTLNNLRYQNFEVNGKYQFTPAFFVGGQYVYSMETYDSTAGTVKPHIHSAGLMADYFLSKRTDVYVQGVYQKIAGSSTGSVMDQAFIPGTQGVSSNSEQFVARVALRHAF
ncbi:MULTISPECIES: porin [Caballeronia]|jgi:predicted porin|uniref:porin n=1 Tax=Caballeronia TaxID=1827195 RepID=UPI00158B9844|nr:MULTISPECIES: porin [Caballeronia]MCG7401708.1 porin [Caballeronia zhejiangensis]MCI1045278.1 porin [Caballeronia zhejiangensis]MDR5767045.1 porin [Caballeronia sp. LZ028]MDR5795561.1 porin [Caballeronia sp. LZ008]